MLMLINKIKPNYIHRNKTILFDTENKQKDNLIIIPTIDESIFYNTISSDLFKRSLLRNIYTPYVIKPLNKKIIRIHRKEYYKNATSLTKKQLRPGMFNIASYVNKNLIYDINIEYKHSLSLATKYQGEEGLRIYNTMYNSFHSILDRAIEDADYRNNILVFPFPAIDNFKQLVMTNKANDEDIVEPIIMFVRDLKNSYDQIGKSIYSKIKAIILYSIQANAIIKIDPKEIDPSTIGILIQRIIRLQNTTLGDMSVMSEAIEESYDEESEKISSFEDVKRNVFKKIMSKSLNFDEIDLEPETIEEEEYYENLNKVLSSSISKNISTPTEDEDVTKAALKFLNLKKSRQPQLERSIKGIETQNELVDSIYSDEEENFDKNQLNGEIIPISDSRLSRLAKTTVSSFDKEYSEKLFKEDVVNIFTSFSHNTVLPLTLANFKIVDASDSKNYQDRIHASFNVIGRTDRRISFTINIPKLYNDYFLYIGGTKFSFNKQLVMLPMTKTAPDEVKITTNGNIFFINRTNGRLSQNNDIFLKILKEYRANPSYTIISGDNAVENTEFGVNNIEYLELSSELYSISSPQYDISFNAKAMYDEAISKGYNIPSKEFIILGTNKIDNSYVYLNDRAAVWSVKLNEDGTYKDTRIHDNLFLFLIEGILKYNITVLPKLAKKVVYTEIKIAGSRYPLIIILSMLNGLQKVMNTYNIKYIISDSRLENSDRSMNEIQFKDKWMYYDNKIENEILMNGLLQAHPESFSLSDFNRFEPYDSWIASIKGLSPALRRHFKNTMNVTLSSFLDPISIEVLKHYKLPYEPLKLLLEANTKLRDNKYYEFQDMRNYRLRGYEQIAAALYYSLNQAYSDYLKAYLNGASMPQFNIDENIIINQLHKLPTVNSYSSLNPMNELNEITKSSPRGFLGINMTDSYSLKNRGFDTQQLAFQAAMATGASGGVGIMRDLVYRPQNLSNLRGYVDKPFDIDSADAMNMLAPSELLLPFASTHDDPQRIAMLNTQSTHTMPIKSPNKRLWSSGFERILPAILSDDFAFKAKADGKVVSIDEKNNIAILEYDNGKRDLVDLSETFLRNSASSFYVKQAYVFRLKQGDRFFKNDVIAYNKDYFELGQDGKTVEYTMGALAKVALIAGPELYNDACMITSQLDKRLTSTIVMPTSIELPIDSQIKVLAKEGDHVEVGDVLIEYITAGGDLNTAQFIKSLSAEDDLTEDLYANTKEAKYHGKIAAITVHHNVPIETLSEDIQKLIKDAKKKQDARIHSASGTNSYNLKIATADQQEADAREDGIKYEGCLIRFFIETEVDTQAGSKVTFDTALKGIISRVLDDNQAPYSEYRPDEEISAIMSPTGYYSRKTGSIYYLMYTNKALIELGKQIKDIWTK